MPTGDALLRRVLPVRDAIGVMALAIAVAVLEGIGVVLLMPLLSLVGIDAGDGATAEIVTAVRDTLTAIGIPVSLATVLVVYVLLLAVQAGLSRAEAITSVRVREAAAERMRHLLYQAITRMRWRSFIERHSSHYVHSLTTQLDRAVTAISQSMTFGAQVLIALVYVVIAVRIAPLLSAVALAAGTLLMLATRRYARALQVSGTELNLATQRLHTAVVEHLSNMKVAKSHAAERQHLEHFEASSRAVVSTWAATGTAFAGSRWIFSVGAAVMLAVVVYAGVVAFGLDAAAILLLLYIFGRLVPRVGALQQLMHQILHNLPAFRATAADMAAFENAAEPEAAPAELALAGDSEVKFERVSFGYVEDQPVVSDLSFHVPTGHITVIVGPSGGGKTTIADLLLGLVEPSGGRILVGPTPLTSEVAGAWRRSVAYVPQETVLFNDTVRRNLLWAVPGASETELRDAIVAAQADFVYSLPRALDTVVGERGSWLSGGERQRLAIARALLRRPRLLLMDEPTSNLDAASERRILDVIASLRGSTTVVLISHRDAALKIADNVLVVHQGRVVHTADAEATDTSTAAVV